MNELLLILYETLCEALPFGVSLGLLAACRKRDGLPLSASGLGMVSLLALYIMGVLHFTGAGTLGGGLMLGLDLQNINLIPFSQHPISIPGYCLNVLLFLPLGFLAPMLYKDCRKPLSVLMLGFGFSVLIEASQILSFRATDIDDVILNTLGAMAGWGLYRLAASHLPKWELPGAFLNTAVLAPFLGRFFLYYELGFIHYIYTVNH